MPRTDDPAAGSDPALDPGDAALIAAARRRQGNRLPVWFMRQAGRSLPEYRRVKNGLGLLEACTRPELVTEITLQPVRRFGVDGAVIYSDIVVPLRAVGIELDIVAGTGPVIAEPFRTAADVERLQPLDPDRVDFVAESARLLVAELGQTPLIGFAGAPFTLASYLVEGGPSRDFARTKAMMLADPQLWHELCSRLAAIAADFLTIQVRSGARIVQLFDSWVGSLSLADYRTFVQPHSAAILRRMAELGVPTIHFGVGTGELLVAMAEAGADVVGVDWRLPLAEASRRIGPGHAVQGNLDPALLGAPWPVLADRVREVIRSGAEAPGHIFNLGHGVPPSADPDVLARIVDLVHEEGPAIRAESLP